MDIKFILNIIDEFDNINRKKAIETMVEPELTEFKRGSISGSLENTKLLKNYIMKKVSGDKKR